MTKTLREQLIGAWKLVSYVEKPVDGSDPAYPMGEGLEGFIIYSRDGYMSVQLMRPDRSKFSSGDWSDGTEREIGEAASGYFAYAGPFDIDEEKKILTHAVAVSLDPNWLGQLQRRVVRIEGDILRLSTEKPLESKGKETMYHLTWKRAGPLLEGHGSHPTTVR
jgi:hypothetical protein